MGTRILLSEECPVHPELKTALCAADELSTDVIMRPIGFAHRVWLNEPAKKVAEIEATGGGTDIVQIYPYVSGEAARRMYETGDLQAGTVSVSQAVGLVREVKPLRDIFVEMMGDAQRIHASLGA